MFKFQKSIQNIPHGLFKKKFPNKIHFKTYRKVRFKNNFKNKFINSPRVQF